MGITKYEECYLLSKNDFLSVEKLSKIYDTYKGKYDREYYGDFYCPECFEAQLSFHPNALTPYFKTKPTAKHNDLCSYNFLPASKKEIENFCNDPRNHDAINRKLKACLDLLNKHIKDIQPVNPNRDERNNGREYFTFGEGEKRKGIRRKKISMPLNESKDYNLPLLFYGSVVAKWDLQNDKVKYLRMRNAITNKNICSISVSNNIYEYIDNNMKFEERKQCDIAFFAAMIKKDNYNNCAINYSTELIIRNITTV